MISGGHSVIFSKDADADRAFFRDVLQLTNVDVGSGWLIFGLPPSEIAFHPDEKSGRQEFYFLTDDISAFIKLMDEHMIECSKPKEEEWGIGIQITLPGSGKLGVYQPMHDRPEPMD